MTDPDRIAELLALAERCEKAEGPTFVLWTARSAKRWATAMSWCGITPRQSTPR